MTRPQRIGGGRTAAADRGVPSRGFGDRTADFAAHNVCASDIAIRGAGVAGRSTADRSRP